MKTVKTNVLGTEYEVVFGKRKEIGVPKTVGGQCYSYQHKISVEHSMRDCQKKEERDGRTVDVLAHEMFHAYVEESGLDISPDTEEQLACWYMKMWRKMNNSILQCLDKMNLLD